MKTKVIFLSKNELLVIDENGNTKHIKNETDTLKELILDNELEELNYINKNIEQCEEKITDYEHKILESKKAIDQSKKFALAAPIVMILAGCLGNYIIGDISFIPYGFSVGVGFHLLALISLIVEKRTINRCENKIALISNREEENKRKIRLHKKAILALDDNFTNSTQQVVNLQQYQEKTYDIITKKDINNIKIKKRTRTLK